LKIIALNLKYKTIRNTFIYININILTENNLNIS
jgi:hypothetical protein